MDAQHLAQESADQTRDRRGLTRRRLFKITGGAGLLALLAACERATPSPSSAPAVTTGSAAPAAPVVNPGKLTVLTPSLGSGRFDVGLIGFSAPTQQYGKIVHGPLIATNNAFEKLPGILTKWSLSDDGLTWKFTVREGVKFHDGRDVTMDDVVWSFRHAFGPDAKNYIVAEEYARISAQVRTIEATGPREVTVTTAAPVLGLLSQLFDGESSWFGIMPKREKVSDKDAEAAYDRKPVGTGVMKLVEYVSGTRMTFERFDDYYHQPKYGLPDDRRVRFRQLELVQVPENSTRVAALQAGQADVVPINLADRKQIEGAGGRVVFGKEGSYLNAYIYGVQSKTFPWSDKRVRDALNLAINKEQMRDRLLGGSEAFEIKGFMGFTRSTIGYAPGLDPLPFDAERARKLLSDAGYPGGKGMPRMTLLIQNDGSAPGIVDSGQLAAASWKNELGLDVDVQVSDDTTIKKQRNSGELTQKGIILWRTNSPRNDPTLKIFEALDDSKPYFLIADKDLFSEAKKSAAILNDAQRADAYRRLLKRMYDTTPAISIGSYNPVWGVGRRIRNWQPYPLVERISALHTIELVD